MARCALIVVIAHIGLLLATFHCLSAYTGKLAIIDRYSDFNFCSRKIPHIRTYTPGYANSALC